MRETDATIEKESDENERENGERTDRELVVWESREVEDFIETFQKNS